MCSLFFRVRISFCFSEMGTFCSFGSPSDLESATRYFIKAIILEADLIYKVDIKDDRTVDVDMTLTTPNCPAAAELPLMVENAVASVQGVGPVTVQVVWDPPWDPSRMSDEARLVLNMW